MSVSGGSPAKPVHILGVPLDHGAGRRGVGMGPSALRFARLHEHLERVGCEISDHGDVEVAIPETIAPGDAKAKFLPLITDVCAALATSVGEILDGKGFPLVIGGDHSIAIGTISGIAAHMAGASGERPPALGVIWFDAHGDINTPETTPSGNIHGMPVACLLDRGPEELRRLGFAGPKVDPMHFVQVGLRDIDPAERKLLVESGVYTFTMTDIDRRGMGSVMEEALEIACHGTDFLHVDFDIDVLDPRIAPGTGTSEFGGLTYREAHLCLEMVAESGRLGSFSMVEVNPMLDVRNQTAELAVGLIASALGKTIL